LKKKESQARSSNSSNGTSITSKPLHKKKEIRRYGAAYKQNSSEQLVKPNKLLLETLLIDKQ
jgi:hypothetical protein